MATVEYDRMFVKDLRKVLAEKPVAYLPLGTLEMHGEHLSFGQDAIKAHELCKRAAERSGGAVLPPLHAGMQQTKSFNFGNIYISEALTLALYKEFMQELARIGFKAIVALTGHYPNGQVAVTKRAAADVMDLTGAWIVGLAEYELALDHGYTGDHAGKWETSLYWHLRPDLTRMENLPEDLAVPLVAAGPEDPRIHASQELGAETCAAIVDRLVAFVDRLLEFDADPVTHGPTHTHMCCALRGMARAHEGRGRGACRRTDEYREACALFYVGEFARANAVLSRIASEAV